MNCDPCVFCQHCYDDSDPSVGMYGRGCDSDNPDAQEFDSAITKNPCPDFKPILASDGLFEQLQNEEDARFWTNLEKERKHGRAIE